MPVHPCPPGWPTLSGCLLPLWKRPAPPGSPAPKSQGPDFENLLITIHDTNRDRVTFLPDDEPFLQRQRAHLERAHRLYDAHPDVPVSIPRPWPANAPGRKHPGIGNACSLSWGLSVDPLTLTVRRHHLHLHPSGIQRAITAAVCADGIIKRATAHTLRAPFAVWLKEAAYQLDDIQKLKAHTDIRTVRELLGHKDVRTTMIHTHVLQRSGLAVRSPLICKGKCDRRHLCRECRGRSRGSAKRCPGKRGREKTGCPQGS